jgi:hypothetical protein
VDERTSKLSECDHLQLVIHDPRWFADESQSNQVVQVVLNRVIGQPQFAHEARPRHAKVPPAQLGRYLHHGLVRRKCL